MNISIIEKKDNPLFERTEVRFRIDHEDGATPKRGDVREKLAGLLNTRKNNVVVDHMTSRFGRGSTDGEARIYPNPETATKHERLYLIKRNNLEEFRAKKKKEAEA